jgi:hypothetical protein
MPSRVLWASFLLAVLGSAGAATSEDLRVATSLYAFSLMEFWKHAPPPLPEGADAEVQLGTSTLETFALPAGGSVDPGPAMLARARRLLAAEAEQLRLVDTLETLGPHAFRVREWRDTAYGSDSAWRARIYSLHRGGVLFLASLHYRAGGCGTTLFTVRRGLETLEITGTDGIAMPGAGAGKGIRQEGAGGTAWDALGRLHAPAGPLRVYRNSMGNSAATGVRGAAKAACGEMPPEAAFPGPG